MKKEKFENYFRKIEKEISLNAASIGLERDMELYIRFCECILDLCSNLQSQVILTLCENEDAYEDFLKDIMNGITENIKFKKQWKDSNGYTEEKNTMDILGLVSSLMKKGNI